MDRDFCLRPGRSGTPPLRTAALALLLTLGATRPGLSEEPSHCQTSSTGQTAVPVTTTVVDGAVNPELIPDDVAYLHFFRVLFKKPKSPNQAFEERRRRAYLSYFFPTSCVRPTSPAGPLNETQIAKLLLVVDTLIPQLDAASARAAIQGGAAPADPSQEIQQLVLAAAADLPNSVDADAAAKIAAHIRDHMKNQIRLVQAQVPYPSK